MPVNAHPLHFVPSGWSSRIAHILAWSITLIQLLGDQAMNEYLNALLVEKKGTNIAQDEFVHRLAWPQLPPALLAKAANPGGLSGCIVLNGKV